MGIERLIIAAFILIAVVIGLDVWDDLNHGAEISHVIFEAAAFCISAGMASWYVWQYTRQALERAATDAANLRDLAADRDRWRSQSEHYLKGLGEAIDRQFEDWGLSHSEKEIALLILKGLAHKEIADLRATSERTVRQQAAAIYSKAGISNKSQLAAFFLEDLMLPEVRK